MRKLLFFIAFILSSFFSNAATRTWIGLGSNSIATATDISNDANWSGGIGIWNSLDDYTITIDNFNQTNNIVLTYLTTRTFGSLVIIFTANGNSNIIKNLTISIAANLTITGNLAVKNLGVTGNFAHPFNININGGITQCGSFNMHGGGQSANSITDLLYLNIGASGTFTSIGNFTIDNPSSKASTCKVINSGIVNILDTTTVNNFQSAGGGAELDAENGGRFNFYGGVNIANSTSPVYFASSLSAVQSTGTMYFYRNADFGSSGVTRSGSNNIGTFIFDSPGAQTITCSNAALKFSNVKIGEANSPTVTLAGSPGMGNSATTANLSINNSAVLVIPSGYTLNRDVSGGTLSMPSTGTLRLGGITGGITGSNFPNLFTTYTLDSVSTVEFNGASQTIPGAAQLVTSYGNLTTAGTLKKSLGSNIAVYRKLTFGAGTTFTPGAFSTTLKSNNKTTAYVAPITTAIIDYTAGIGRFIVERYISRLRRWQFLSVPTDSTQTIKSAWQEGAASMASNPVPGYGMQITNPPGTTCAGCDAISPSGYSLKTYNSLTNGYTGITGTTDVISTTQGFMSFVRGDRTSLSSPTTTTVPTTLRTKGKLYTGVQPTISILGNKYAAIGNPFAAPINLLNLSMTGLAGTLPIMGTVYLWDPSLTGIYGLGAFQTLTYNFAVNNYDITPGGGLYPTGTWSRVESGQAFWVKANFIGGTVAFTETAKDFGSSLVSLTGPRPDMTRKLRVNLYAAANGESSLLDGTLTYFNNQFANGEDGMDATKMINTGENISLRSGIRNLVVDYRSLPRNDDTIFINLANTFVRNYELELNALNLQVRGRSAYLEDKYLQRITAMDLNGIIKYGFKIENIPGSYAADRFRIIFKQEIFPVAITDIRAERNIDRSVNVNWNVENEINVATLEIESAEDQMNFIKLGNVVPQNNNSIAAYSFTDSKASLNAVYYRIKSTETNGKMRYSDIAKANPVTDMLPALSIYPNPVTGGNLILKMINKPAGTYLISISDIKGEIIHRERIEVNQIHSLHTIALNHSTAPGSYLLSVTYPGSKKIILPFILK